VVIVSSQRSCGLADGTGCFAGCFCGVGLPPRKPLLPSSWMTILTPDCKLIHLTPVIDSCCCLRAGGRAPGGGASVSNSRRSPLPVTVCGLGLLRWSSTYTTEFVQIWC